MLQEAAMAYDPKATTCQLARAFRIGDGGRTTGGGRRKQ